MDSDTFEYQYLFSFSKNGFYAGINDENELVYYVYNEFFYAPIFSYRNAAFNTKIDKFNIYKSSLTKTSILDTHIYKLDLSQVAYSGIKANPNKVI